MFVCGCSFVCMYVCVGGGVGGGRGRGGAYVPWRQVQLETRLRIEKEKLDEINKVCESKDEQIAHLRR